MRNVMFLCIVLSVMCFGGCSSNSLEKASLRSLSETDIEGYIFTESEVETIDGIRMISKKDTEVLKSLLDIKNGWAESELCDCIGSYEVVLDDTRYILDLWDAKHPIMYGPVNGTIKGAMIHEEKEMLKVYRIIRKWMYLESSYEDILNKNAKKTEQASISIRGKTTEEKVMLSVEDTRRVRQLLSVDSGWDEEEWCECIGEYELILDNISYIIDVSDVDHQIKTEMIGLTNEDKEVVREIYNIVKKYIKD